MTADPDGKWYAKDEADAIITEYQAIAIQAASQLQAERIRTRELEAERDAARADAERLDAGCIQFETRDELGQPMTVRYFGVDLRAAIDAARSKP
jgi:hypothetical protein